MYVPARQNTNRILEAIAEGLLDRDVVILAALNHMDDNDVGKMAEANEFFPEDIDSEDEEDGESTINLWR